MRKYLSMIILLLLMLSCQTQKVKPSIIYFLPSNVKEILHKEIQKRKGDGKKIYVVFEKEDSDTYLLYLNTVSNDSETFWLQHSNRAIFLEGELIPFYFYSDEYFSYAEDGKDVIKKLGTEKDIKKVINKRENTFHVKFKINGEIVK
jgi:hypothetical protein